MRTDSSYPKIRGEKGQSRGPQQRLPDCAPQWLLCLILCRCCCSCGQATQRQSHLPRLAASHRSSATWTTRGREAVGRGYCQRWSHSSNAKDGSPIAPFHRCALSTRRFYTTCGRNCASDLWLAMRMARSCIPPLLFSERNPPNVAQCLQTVYVAEDNADPPKRFPTEAGCCT
jgi:hypothetical protein